MDVKAYQRRLLDQEQLLLTRINRALENARERDENSVGDGGDASRVDERRDEQLTEADADSTQLLQVRAALARVEAGTFGTCQVDGEPIDAKRLDAVPWTPFCLTHAEQTEDPSVGRVTL